MGFHGLKLFSFSFFGFCNFLCDIDFCSCLFVSWTCKVLSNTMYKSVLHRAVVNSSSQRLSLACFLNPPLNATVAAPPELITPEWPQIYRPFTWLEYLKNAYLYHPITGADRHERFFLSTAASS